MKRKFGYVETTKMDPRPGVKFSTTYYKQTKKQRQHLAEFLIKCIREIGEEEARRPELYDWFDEPLKGFPKTGKQANRTFSELIMDILGEIGGTKRDGTPKDFAQAPLERWNKLFKETEYEFDLVKTWQDTPTTLEKIFHVQS